MRYLFPIPHTSRVKAVSRPWEHAITGPEQCRIAKRAEELGYDMIRISEHLVVPRAHVELSGPHYFHSTAAQGFIQEVRPRPTAPPRRTAYALGDQNASCSF